MATDIDVPDIKCWVSDLCQFIRAKLLIKIFGLNRTEYSSGITEQE